MEAVSWALISERGGFEPPRVGPPGLSQSILAIQRELHIYTKSIALAIFFPCARFF
jgi:hypothetical protein